MSDVLVFVFSLFDGISLLFLSVYFIITLSDLECDYINARSCCSKLNRVLLPFMLYHWWRMLVLPEMIAMSAVSLVLLISGHWLLLLLNLPLTSWQIYKYVSLPQGNMGKYDPTEIHNRLHLRGYMRESMIKLGYHLLFFFLFLYSLIISLLS